MEVNKPEAPISAKRDGSRKKYQHLLNRNPDSEEQGADNYQKSGDTVEIAGGMSVAISPQVQHIIDSLIGELEPLRLDLERLRAREKDLHDRLDRHHYLPVLNRRGLEHEFARVVGHIKGLVSATFVCISVLNAEDLRQQSGREIYEDAMLHICDLLSQLIGLSDIIGCLGGHDLGILTLAPDDDVAKNIKTELECALQKSPFRFHGGSIQLNIAVGSVVLKKGLSFGSALQAADSDLLS